MRAQALSKLSKVSSFLTDKEANEVLVAAVKDWERALSASTRMDIALSGEPRILVPLLRRLLASENAASQESLAVLGRALSTQAARPLEQSIDRFLQEGGTLTTNALQFLSHQTELTPELQNSIAKYFSRFDAAQARLARIALQHYGNVIGESARAYVCDLSAREGLLTGLTGIAGVTTGQ